MLINGVIAMDSYSGQGMGAISYIVNASDKEISYIVFYCQQKVKLVHCILL